MNTGKKLLIFAGILVGAAFLKGIAPIVIDEAFDIGGFTSVLLIAIVVAIIGVIKTVKAKQNYDNNKTMRFDSSISASDIQTFDGAIEYKNGEFIVYKKSLSVRIAFGAVGNALASGKEVMRFPYYEIKAYKFSENTINNVLSIDLADGRYIQMTLNSNVKKQLMSLLAQVNV